MLKYLLNIILLSCATITAMDPTSPRLRRDTNHAISPRLSLGVAGAPEEHRRMENDITEINLNPITQPHAFFNELDRRIIFQKQSLKIACTQRDITAVTNHFNNIAALLKKAEEHAPDFQKAYEESHPAEGALKRSQGDVPRESLEHLLAFRMQTTKLLEALTSITEGPINDQEWSLMAQVFKVFSSPESLKKSRVTSDK